MNITMTTAITIPKSLLKFLSGFGDLILVDVGADVILVGAKRLRISLVSGEPFVTVELYLDLNFPSAIA